MKEVPKKPPARLVKDVPGCSSLLIIAVLSSVIICFACADRKPVSRPPTPTSGYASECDSIIDFYRNLDDAECQLQRNEMLETIFTQQAIIEALEDSLRNLQKMNRHYEKRIIQMSEYLAPLLDSVNMTMDEYRKRKSINDSIHLEQYRKSLELFYGGNASSDSTSKAGKR